MCSLDDAGNANGMSSLLSTMTTITIVVTVQQITMVRGGIMRVTVPI